MCGNGYADWPLIWTAGSWPVRVGVGTVFPCRHRPNWQSTKYSFGHESEFSLGGNLTIMPRKNPVGNLPFQPRKIGGCRMTCGA